MNNNLRKIELQKFLNENIPLESFLLIDQEKKSLGMVKKEDAISIAKSANLDVFWINHNLEKSKPVCKILSFSKYFYQAKKSESIKNKSLKKNSILKQSKFYYKIGENDKKTKIKKIIDWLNENLTVKVIVFIKKRDLKYREEAVILCEELSWKIRESSPLFKLKGEIKHSQDLKSFSFDILKSKK